MKKNSSNSTINISCDKCKSNLLNNKEMKNMNNSKKNNINENNLCKIKVNKNNHANIKTKNPNQNLKQKKLNNIFVNKLDN